MSSVWWEFFAISLAHALAVMSPGPDFALVIRQSWVNGRRTATWSALGIGSGILVHVTYSLLGVGLLLRSSPNLFLVVKLAGAGYLGWLGWQALRARSGGAIEPVEIDAGSISARPAAASAWLRGFLTNVLNPKATLFFVALFSLGVRPETSKWVQFGYGLWMSLTTAAWFSLVAHIFTRSAVRAVYARFGLWLDRLTGVVFLAFAGGLLFARLN